MHIQKVFALILLMLFCLTAEAAESVIVSDDALGAPVALNLGDELTVRLAGNPTTGYMWQVVETPLALAPAGEPEFQQDEAPENMVGVGGVFIFRFSVQSGGEGALRFVYKRPWENKDERPEKTVAIQIRVSQ